MIKEIKFQAQFNESADATTQYERLRGGWDDDDTGYDIEQYDVPPWDDDSTGFCVYNLGFIYFLFSH